MPPNLHSKSHVKSCHFAYFQTSRKILASPPPCQILATPMHQLIISHNYSGAFSCRTLYVNTKTLSVNTKRLSVNTKTLYWQSFATCSQCNSLSTGDMWARRSARLCVRAEESWVNCSFLINWFHRQVIIQAAKVAWARYKHHLYYCLGPIFC